MLLDNKNIPEIDYEDGLARFSGNKQLYEKFLYGFLKDETYNGIKKSIKEEDFVDAFKCAHTLKGISGNLSLQRLYNACIPFVEMLRNNKDTGAAVNSLNELDKIYISTISAINQFKNSI